MDRWPAEARARPSVLEIAQAFLRDPRAVWTMGVEGALAEFMRAPDEPAELRMTGAGGTVATARGALRLRLRPETRAVAFETLSAHPGRWGHGVALCLSSAHAKLAKRGVLTTLGPDRNAIRAADRDDALYDLGVAAGHAAFCVRTGEIGLRQALAVALGHPVLAGAGGALGALLSARPSPHRVVSTALGRIEVYGAIPPPAHDGGASPAGPHTHLMPERLGRPEPRPRGMPEDHVVCTTIHPPGTPMDALGRACAVDPADHGAFQALLAEHGDPAVQAEKRRVWKAIADGCPADAFAEPASSDLLSALRIALRQRRALYGGSADLARYVDRFDPPRSD